MANLIRLIKKSQLNNDEGAASRRAAADRRMIKAADKAKKKKKGKVAAQPKVKSPKQNKINAPKKNPKSKNAAVKKGGKKGLKRKGRLPSKIIVNKLGNKQTVYYRPDKKTKSKYINPKLQTTSDLMGQYKDSFKRMLFLDHNDLTNWKRDRGGKDHAQGGDMVSKLDKLADKYDFNFDNFDGQWDKLVKDNFKGMDEFLQDAQNIYGDMYKVGDRHPFEFLSKIFAATKSKLHSKHNRVGIEKALAAQNIVPRAEAKKKSAKRKTAVKPKIASAKAPSASGTSGDDDDDRQQQSTAGVRNVKSIINDPVVVRNANDFIKKYKIG